MQGKKEGRVNKKERNRCRTLESERSPEKDS